jgi:hypothetical protein
MSLESRVADAELYVDDLTGAVEKLPGAHKEMQLRILQGLDFQCRTFHEQLNYVTDPDRSRLIQRMKDAGKIMRELSGSDAIAMDDTVRRELTYVLAFFERSIKSAEASPFNAIIV